MKITHNPDTLKKKSIFIFLYSLPVLVHVYNFYNVKTYQRYNFLLLIFFFNKHWSKSFFHVVSESSPAVAMQ